MVMGRLKWMKKCPSSIFATGFHVNCAGIELGPTVDRPADTFLSHAQPHFC